MSSKCMAALKVAFVFAFISSHANAGINDTTPECAAATKSSVGQKCEEAAKTAASLLVQTQADGMNSGANDLTLQQAMQKSFSVEGIEKCKKAVEKCRSVCENAKGAPKQTCDRFASYTAELEQGVAANDQGMAESQATSDATTQSAQPGMNPEMKGMLIGAVAGGVLSYMLTKKGNKDDDGALLSNGQIDCSKEDAYKYQDCATYLEVNCMSSIDSPNCARFASIFCAGSSSSSPGSKLGLSRNSPPPTQAGAGVGTPFCKQNLAANYCKVSGRNQCPSCLSLARLKSPACQQDPSLCLAQNSPDQIAAAKVTCPTDPAFSDPAYANGGGSQVPTELQVGAPAVVLPESGSASANGAVAGAANGAASGVVTGAEREGQAGRVDSQANYEAGGNAGIATGTSREMASAGVPSTFQTASSGPLPDVEGPFGPSLFRTSTDVIKSRCDAGKLNNCPNSR